MRHITYRFATSMALVVGLATLAGGCGGDTRACKKGTLLVDVTLAEPADALDITITTGANAPITKQAALKSGTTKGTIEVDFPSGYPAGQMVTVSIVASSAGVAVGSGSTTETLTAGCDHFDVAITGSGNGDMNVNGNGDMTGEDGGQCVPMCTTCGGTVTVCGVQLSCQCAVVNSLQNPFTAAGDTITIEGSGFVDGATVTFPGGVSAPATVISPQRLTAVVPATAGRGVLTVNQNGLASNAVAFRRASFTLGVDPLRSYEQADYGHLTPMITPRFGASAVVGEKYVWVIGGFDGTLGFTTPPALGNTVVEQALINADGTIGGFVQTAPLTVDRYHQSAVRIGSWVYVLGGISQGAATNKVERAPINSDGTLGTFADAGTTLSTARYNFATAVVGGWLYAMGGVNGVKCSSPTTLASVERAPIAADGTVGAFADAGITLPDARSTFTTFVADKTLYALGGANVAMSTIAADGTLGAFAAGGGASGAGTVEYAFTMGGNLYEVGDFASTVTASAPYTLDGTLGTFTPTTTSPGAGSTLLAYAVIGHYLYGFGGGAEPGCVGGLQFHESGNTVRASLDAGSDLVNFSTVASGGLNVARSAFGAVVIGNHVYAIGGQTDLTKPDVEMATVDGSGVLGPFSYVSGVSLVTQRSSFATAIVDNKLYVVSGIDKNSTALSSVEVAPIGSDGTLGAFAAAMAGSTAVTIANARAGLRLIAVGTIVGTSTPELCALGGGTTLEVDCVSVNGDGTLAGNFTAVSGVNLVSARDDSPAVLLNGAKVTVALGSSAPAEMEQATLDATTLAFTTTFASINTTTSLRDDGVAALMLGNHWLITGGHYSEGGPGGNMFSAAVSYSNVDPATGTIALPVTDANSVLASFRADHRLVAVENQVYSIGGTSSGFPADYERSEMR